MIVLIRPENIQIHNTIYLRNSKKINITYASLNRINELINLGKLKLYYQYTSDGMIISLLKEVN